MFLFINSCTNNTEVLRFLFMNVYAQCRIWGRRTHTHKICDLWKIVCSILQKPSSPKSQLHSCWIHCHIHSPHLPVWHSLVCVWGRQEVALVCTKGLQSRDLFFTCLGGGGWMMICCCTGRLPACAGVPVVCKGEGHEEHGSVCLVNTL